MNWLLQFDTNIFLAINGWHSTWADEFFYVVSLRWVWIPVYVWLIWLLIKNYGIKTGIIYTVSIIGLVALVDLISVQIFKEWFLRLRPCHNPAIANQVHVYENDCGGLHGFVSSHAANFGAWCSLGFLWLRGKVKFIGWFLLASVLLVGYSRIYLGRHYPLDVMVGAIVGAFMALSVYLAFKKWYKPVL